MWYTDPTPSNIDMIPNLGRSVLRGIAFGNPSGFRSLKDPTPLSLCLRFKICRGVFLSLLLGFGLLAVRREGLLVTFRLLLGDLRIPLTTRSCFLGYRATSNAPAADTSALVVRIALGDLVGKINSPMISNLPLTLSASAILNPLLWSYIETIPGCVE